MLKMCISALALLAAACAHAPEAGLVNVSVSAGRPVVTARLGPLGARPVIFDTAAQGSLVRESLVAPLGLEVIGEAETGAGLAQGVVSPVVDLGALEVGGASAADTAAVVLRDDLAPFGESAGLISPTIFAGHVVELDLAANTLWIGDAPRRPVDTWISIAAGDKLNATLVVEGISVEVTLDTGNPRALLLPRALMSQLAAASAQREAADVQTIETMTAAASATLNVAATLAGHAVQLGEVQFVDWPRGNLGTSGLRGFVIVIDNPNRRWALLGAARGVISHAQPAN